MTEGVPRVRATVAWTVGATLLGIVLPQRVREDVQ
jgi:hypothetical protein